MKRLRLMQLFIISASISLLCLPSLCFSGNYYVYLQPGVYIPQHDHAFIVDNNFDTGPNIEVVFGKYVNPNISGEMGIGYFATKGELTSPRTQLKEQVFDIFYTLKGIAPIGPVELYGGGGFGVYITKSSVYADHEVNTNLGLHVLAGGRFNINEKLFVGVEGKYLWSSTSFSNGNVIDDAQLDGVFVGAHIGVKF